MMAINISSRVSRAMVGLSLILCALFALTTFLLVYVIEDQLFINQIKAEQASYNRLVKTGSKEQIKQWQPSNANIKRISETDKLPKNLPAQMLDKIVGQPGIHEYFDDHNAIFIANFRQTTSNDPYYLVYDVSKLLVVRNTRNSLTIIIVCLTLFITVIAVFSARRLSRSTLAPISRLTHALQTNELDDIVIELAQEFSEDQFSILTRELVLALERVRDASEREYEFNRGVSHELRSPIQVAQSAGELLQLYVSDNETTIKDTVARLQRSLIEMNEISETFLWLASNQMVSDTQCCTIEDLRDLLQTLEDTLPKHQIIISSALLPKPSLSTANNILTTYPLPTKLMSLLMRHLVNNAVTHGRTAAIEVNLEQQRITVKNLVNEGSQQSQGFGVGLSIVRRICERFSCGLTSELKNGGVFVSTLSFDTALPKASVANTNVGS